MKVVANLLRVAVLGGLVALMCWVLGPWGVKGAAPPKPEWEDDVGIQFSRGLTAGEGGLYVTCKVERGPNGNFVYRYSLKNTGKVCVMARYDLASRALGEPSVGLLWNLPPGHRCRYAVLSKSPPQWWAGGLMGVWAPNLDSEHGCGEGQVPGAMHPAAMSAAGYLPSDTAPRR